MSDPTQLLNAVNECHRLREKLRQLEKENQKLEAENRVTIEALNKIAYHPHNTEERNIDIQDGHRCAAQIARDCLSKILKGEK